MCRLLKVHPSGFYAWLKEPLSNKAKDDLRLTDLLKQAWLESGCVYGYRKLHDDLRSLGEVCSLNKVAWLTSLAAIKAQIGYKRKAGFYGGRLAVVAPNHLARVFYVEKPDQAWVADITYIKTHEG
ncbi:MAG: putative transposase [Sneathiella sp.]|jgi:putative transposase